VFDCTDAASILSLQKELTKHFISLQSEFAAAIETKDSVVAINLCVRMKYFGKMLEELREKSSH
jgi:hypothetical protein